MGAVPKSKIGPRRKHKRRTHHKLEAVPLVRCDQCDSYHVPHHVCRNCGTYRGVQVIRTEDEEA